MAWGHIWICWIYYRCRDSSRHVLPAPAWESIYMLHHKHTIRHPSRTHLERVYRAIFVLAGPVLVDNRTRRSDSYFGFYVPRRNGILPRGQSIPTFTSFMAAKSTCYFFPRNQGHASESRTRTTISLYRISGTDLPGNASCWRVPLHRLRLGCGSYNSPFCLSTNSRGRGRLWILPCTSIMLHICTMDRHNYCRNLRNDRE